MGQNSLTAGLMLANDERAQAPGYQLALEGQKINRPWEDAVLWPRSRYSGSEMCCAMVSEDSTASGRWGTMPLEAGNPSQKKLIGTSRDSGGAVLGSCTVKAFVTSTDVLAGTTVSDSAGYFEVCTSNSGVAHRIDAYKGGSPDLAGSSVNTLIPV